MLQNNGAIVKRLAEHNFHANKKKKSFDDRINCFDGFYFDSFLSYSDRNNAARKNLVKGSEQFTFCGIDETVIDKLRRVSDVAWVGEYTTVGTVKTDDSVLEISCRS